MSTLAAILTAHYNFPLWIKIILAFLGGLLPVLLWLWFWEHEDKHPEPKKIVFLAFVGGMIGVVVSLVFESSTAHLFSNFNFTLFIWAAIEELSKFGLAYVLVLRRIENHEPIDSMMYMIATALGFSALENALFLFRPIYLNSNLEALATGNLRFMGATLVHTMASGIIGLGLALTFYRSKRAKRVYVTLGVITAIVLHAFFNLSIIVLNESWPLVPFYVVWIIIVFLLLAFEKVKSLTPPN
jgi:RsiW-degrading membrane proteinase PrsW (M82 family)